MWVAVIEAQAIVAKDFSAHRACVYLYVALLSGRKGVGGGRRKGVGGRGKEGGGRREGEGGRGKEGGGRREGEGGRGKEGGGRREGEGGRGKEGGGRREGARGKAYPVFAYTLGSCQFFFSNSNSVTCSTALSDAIDLSRSWFQL